ERSAVNASAAGATNDDRNARAPTVPALCCEIRDLVESAGDEVRELHLGHRTHSHERCADGGSDNSRFRNRSVDDSPLTESFEHACGDFERSTVNADVLAEDEHTFVLLHFFPDTLANRFDVRREAHCSCGS